MHTKKSQLVFLNFRQKLVLSGTTDIFIYQITFDGINIIFSNLNNSKKFWKNIWIHFKYLERHSSRYFWYCEEHEITTYGGKRNSWLSIHFFPQEKSYREFKIYYSQDKVQSRLIWSHFFHSGQIIPKLI
jgi:hypothetical protein